MKTRMRARAGRAVWISALLSLASCGSCASVDDRFTPQQDAESMARVEGTWMATVEGTTVTLIMCEDVNPSESRLKHAANSHVVRGGGRGVPETVEREAHGCGIGFLLARTSLPSGASESLPGLLDVCLSVERADDRPYGLPQGVLFTNEPSASSIVFGKVHGDSTMTAERLKLETIDTRHAVFTRVSETGCPLP